VYRGGFAAGGVMGQGTNLTTNDLPFNDAGVKTFGRIGRLINNTSTVDCALSYNMESQDCYRFIGKTITLSFYYRTGANFSSTILYAAVYTGTGTDQALRSGVTGSLTAGLLTFTPNIAWKKMSLTCTLSANINQIQLAFSYVPVGTALGADYFDITGVQLELGSVATPFEVRPYPVELQICKRYYERFILRIYVYISVANGYFVTFYPFVTKRATPNGGAIGQNAGSYYTSGTLNVAGFYLEGQNINNTGVTVQSSSGTAATVDTGSREFWVDAEL